MTRNVKLFLSLFVVFTLLSVFGAVALAEPEDTCTVKLVGDTESVLAYFDGAEAPANEFQASVGTTLSVRIVPAEGYELESVKLFGAVPVPTEDNQVYTLEITESMDYELHVKTTQVVIELPSEDTSSEDTSSEGPSEDTSSEDTPSEEPSDDPEPSEDISSEDTPSEEPSDDPSEDTSAEDTSSEDTSSEEPSDDPDPSEDTSSEDTSSEDTSSEEPSDDPDPSEDTSSEDTSSEDTPSEEPSDDPDPSEDTSSEDTSSEDTSSEDTSSEEPEPEKSELRVTIKGAGKVEVGEFEVNCDSNRLVESLWLEDNVRVPVKITPAVGYKITGIKLDGRQKDSVSSLAINELTTLEVTFEPDIVTLPKYQIVVSCATAGGYVSAGGYTIISGSATTINVEAGQSLVISVYAAEGYQVEAFTVGGVAQNLTDGTYVLENVAANATITVKFKEVVSEINPSKAEDFSWTPDGNGLIVLDFTGNSYIGKSVFDKINTLTAESGSFVVLKTAYVQWFIPCGSIVEGVEKDYINFAVSVGKDGSYYEIIQNAVLAADAETVFQYFELAETPTFPEGTLVSFNMSEFATATGGDGVDLMVKDGTNLKVVGVGTTEAGGWTTRMNFMTSRNMVVRIKVLDTYVIQAAAGEGGSITPEGANTVSRGGELAFTITANSGYIISAVYVDGVAIEGPAGRTAYLYVASDVSADHVISVEYLSADNNYEIVDNVAVIVEESSEPVSSEPPARDNTGLIVALVIIFVAIVGAAALFIVKWRQEKF